MARRLGIKLTVLLLACMMISCGKWLTGPAENEKEDKEEEESTDNSVASTQGDSIMESRLKRLDNPNWTAVSPVAIP